MRDYVRETKIAAASVRFLPHSLRGALLRSCGVVMGEGACVYGPFDLSGPGRLSLGADVFVNRRAYFDCEADITVGDRVSFGDNVRLITSTHDIGPGTARAGDLTSSAITIGAGAWLGSGSTVLPGVSVGAGCIVAAGAVVTRDCEEHTLYAGIPAKAVRTLER